MKIISYDPSKTIPDCHEREFNTSIILGIWETTSTRFFNYVIKTDRGFQFRGSSASKYAREVSYSSRITNWSDDINCGRTLLHLLERDYTRTYGNNIYDLWKVKYYIIDQLSELLEVLDTYKVNGPLSTEILDRLNEVKLHESY